MNALLTPNPFSSNCFFLSLWPLGSNTSAQTRQRPFTQTRNCSIRAKVYGPRGTFTRKRLHIAVLAQQFFRETAQPSSAYLKRFHTWLTCSTIERAQQTARAAIGHGIHCRVKGRTAITP
uniref:Uncharacterized protein n=1 Tax=Rhipicephalus zambeziensis TaxID=60191 RepID=A0A224YLB2_9ACAR